MRNSIDEPYRRAGRPDAERGGNDADERKDAIEFCRIKLEIDVPKNDDLALLDKPSPSEVENAI